MLNILKKLAYSIVLLGFFLCILVSISFYRPLLVISDSMRPGIAKDSIIIARKFKSSKDMGILIKLSDKIIKDYKTEYLKKGDVIVYKTPKGSLVTHRIVEIQELGSDHLFQTKGDANNFFDSILLSSADIEGKVILVLPYVGLILRFLLSPFVLLFFFYIPTGWVIGKTAQKFVNQIQD